MTIDIPSSILEEEIERLRKGDTLTEVEVKNLCEKVGQSPTNESMWLCGSIFPGFFCTKECLWHYRTVQYCYCGILVRLYVACSC
jgi:hypothetical protein